MLGASFGGHTGVHSGDNEQHHIGRQCGAHQITNLQRWDQPPNCRVVAQGGHWAHQLWGDRAKPGLGQGAVGACSEGWGLSLLSGLAGLCWLSSPMSSTQGNGSRHSATEDFLPVEGSLGQQLGWGSSLPPQWPLAKSSLLVQPCLWSNLLHHLPSAMQTRVNDTLHSQALVECSRPTFLVRNMENNHNPVQRVAVAQGGGYGQHLRWGIVPSSSSSPLVSLPCNPSCLQIGFSKAGVALQPESREAIPRDGLCR